MDKLLKVCSESIKSNGDLRKKQLIEKQHEKGIEIAEHDGGFNGVDFQFGSPDISDAMDNDTFTEKFPGMFFDTIEEELGVSLSFCPKTVEEFVEDCENLAWRAKQILAKLQELKLSKITFSHNVD